MGIISTALKHLIAAGVTGDALVAAIEEMENANSHVKSTSAVRQRRYRERNALRNVTSPLRSDSSHIENARAPDSLFLRELSKKEESKKVSKVTASRFALDAIPDTWLAYCHEKRPDLDPFETFDACRDWWIAQPGSKGLKADWFATWRTWVRRQEAPKNPANDFKREMQEQTERLLRNAQ